MYNLILKLTLSVIITEGVTEIITKSNLFKPLRNFFFIRRKNRVFGWLHDLLDCGYCFSVWVGCFIGILLFRDVGFFNEYIDWFLFGVLIHRLSNVLHFIIDRIDRYNDFDLDNLKEQ